jgi:hypothetical protein
MHNEAIFQYCRELYQSCRQFHITDKQLWCRTKQVFFSYNVSFKYFRQFHRSGRQLHNICRQLQCTSKQLRRTAKQLFNIVDNFRNIGRKLGYSNKQVRREYETKPFGLPRLRSGVEPRDPHCTTGMRTEPRRRASSPVEARGGNAVGTEESPEGGGGTWAARRRKISWGCTGGPARRQVTGTNKLHRNL